MQIPRGVLEQLSPGHYISAHDYLEKVRFLISRTNRLNTKEITNCNHHYSL